MMYAFMQLDDGTEVVHSEAYDDNGTETVKVYFEKPVEGDFESAECYLPRYVWKNIEGFSSERVAQLQERTRCSASGIPRVSGAYHNKTCQGRRL